MASSGPAPDFVGAESNPFPSLFTAAIRNRYFLPCFKPLITNFLCPPPPTRITFLETLWTYGRMTHPVMGEPPSPPSRSGSRQCSVARPGGPAFAAGLFGWNGTVFVSVV